jgi:hypothetical protein
MELSPTTYLRQHNICTSARIIRRIRLAREKQTNVAVVGSGRRRKADSQVSRTRQLAFQWSPLVYVAMI